MSDKEVNLKISEDIYNRLKEQLEQMKLVNIPGMENCKTVEDLIAFYLQQMFRMDSMLFEAMKGIFQKTKSGGLRMQKIFKDIVDSAKASRKDGSSLRPPFDDFYDEEDEFYDEFFDEDDLDRCDSENEVYEELRKYYEDKKKDSKH